MNPVLYAVLALALVAYCRADGEGEGEGEMEVGLKFVGCFKDDYNDRALPVMFANNRAKINWKNMEESVKQCADAADKNGYRTFAVQFYGECWSGPSAEITYNKHGPSTHCWEGVGRGLTNAVYRFYMKPKKSSK